MADGFDLLRSWMSKQPFEPEEGNKRLPIERMDGPVGAVVTGADLAGHLTQAVVDQIWTALLDHGLVWFPGQILSPTQQAAFAENFGELGTYPFVTPLAEHDKVIPVIKEPETKMNFGGLWHTDTSYLPEPPSVTMLQAIEVPGRGGDTLFADMAAAFESLSTGMQKMLLGLIGVYTAGMVHGETGAYSAAAGADHPMDYGDKEGVAERRVEHPIIRTHPETGRKSIFAGSGHCSHIKGMRRSESKVILDWLNAYATKPEFVTRLKWESGSVAMWDNRRVFHYALNDYAGERRHMHRVILKGDRPF